MRSFGTYEVMLDRGYRGHKKGETFNAVLDSAAEARAIGRGDIRVIDRRTPSVQPGSITRGSIFRGWLNKQEEASHEQ